MVVLHRPCLRSARASRRTPTAMVRHASVAVLQDSRALDACEKSAVLGREVEIVGPLRVRLSDECVTWSPSHGHAALTVLLFDGSCISLMPGDDWRQAPTLGRVAFHSCASGSPPIPPRRARISSAAVAAWAQRSAGGLGRGREQWNARVRRPSSGRPSARLHRPPRPTSRRVPRRRTQGHRRSSGARPTGR